MIKCILCHANLNEMTRNELVPMMACILSALDEFETLQDKILVEGRG